MTDNVLLSWHFTTSNHSIIDTFHISNYKQEYIPLPLYIMVSPTKIHLTETHTCYAVLTLGIHQWLVDYSHERVYLGTVSMSWCPDISVILHINYLLTDKAGIMTDSSIKCVNNWCTSHFKLQPVLYSSTILWAEVWIYTAVPRVDSRLAPSQWETLLQSNTVSHWLSANLSAIIIIVMPHEHHVI